MTAALVLLAALRGRPVAGRDRHRARGVRARLRHGHPGADRGRAEQRRAARARRRDRHDRLLPRARRRGRRRRPRRRVRRAGRRARDGTAHVGRAPTSSTASRRCSWSPPRSPRWRSSSSCACPSCPCRPPTASRKEDHMATAFHTAVALRSEQSDGAISVIENAVPAGWDGPPLHHHEFDETFYVLDGELTFQVRDELFTAGPGALAFAPGGVAHTLANLGDVPARYLLLCTPAGFEGYFARLAADAAGEDPPSWALAPTPPVTTVGGQIGERDDIATATPIEPATGGSTSSCAARRARGGSRSWTTAVGAGVRGPAAAPPRLRRALLRARGRADLPARRGTLRPPGRRACLRPARRRTTRSPTTATPRRAR